MLRQHFENLRIFGEKHFENLRIFGEKHFESRNKRVIFAIKIT